MINAPIANLFGYLSTGCVSLALVPQVVKAARSRDVESLSARTFVIYGIGNAAGILFGLAIASGPVILTSVISLAASLTLLWLIRHGASRPASELDHATYLHLAGALAFHAPRSAKAFSVGSVIVNHRGRILATGYSREFGEGWHAEEVAIAKARAAGADLSKATLYSSLEPCASRRSRPQPCAHVIATAGIDHVVYGATEPPTFAPGNGEAVLMQRGIRTTQLDDATHGFEAANAHVLTRP